MNQLEYERDLRLRAMPPLPLAGCEVQFRNDGTYAFVVPKSRYTHSWAREITGIDPTQKHRGGWALKGENRFSGDRIAMSPGGILAVGGRLAKEEKTGTGPQDFALFVVTPAHLVCYRRTNRVSVDYTAELLAMDPQERVETVLTELISEADGYLAKLAALDRDEYAAELSLISERTLAWCDIKERAEKCLAAVDPESNITDIDSAITAIVSAGYKALALKWHPDKGGTAEIMAFLNDGKKQLSELIKLIAAERKN